MGKVLGVIATLGVSAGMGVAAFTPPPAGAKGGPPPTFARCDRAQLRLSSFFIEGATQSEVLGAAIVNRGRHSCSLEGHVSLAIERYTDGRWRIVRAIRDNPNSQRTAIVLSPGYNQRFGAEWQWRNWCGSTTTKFRLLARFGKLSATSAVLEGKDESSALPVCADSSDPSTLAVAFGS